MIFKLPWAPSINGYWRAVKGRQILSKKAREYRKEVLAMIEECECLSERLAVNIDLYPPDRRRRDVDNHTKAVLDALTHAGVWEDDEQIDKLSVARREIVKGGRVEVEVIEMDKLRSSGF